jgi:hypothetical protein
MDLPKEFEGKPLLTVYVSGAKPGAGFVFRSPSIREIGGRVFLIGRVADPANKGTWFAQKVAAVAWDTVTSIVAMDDDEAAAIQALPPHQKREPK